MGNGSRMSVSRIETLCQLGRSFLNQLRGEFYQRYALIVLQQWREQQV
ncbi:hypothetical protein IBO29_002579 [Salmonella enterica]|nr:hypothetical protein [Salmonella enterica]EJA6453863.1 hypothetical protein [Salmonella enterica subsp. enterica serovar Praha]EGF0804724.1 hypothetical protein [Salmonella enterica]EGF6457575.1 hypothetical protein [Salmonella enterica]EGH3350408.1 hypothetical protein [Salmonella enterica]